MLFVESEWVDTEMYLTVQEVHDTMNSEEKQEMSALLDLVEEKEEITLTEYAELTAEMVQKHGLDWLNRWLNYEQFSLQVLEDK